jgi:uncharacterized protein YndB with AHSA1/START domain
MKKIEKISVTVEATINAPVEKVWEFWTTPKHIILWNAASEDWQTTNAGNDLRVGGKFLSRMEAKDGSWGFDFTGEYNNVDTHKLIEYTMSDGRRVQIQFKTQGDVTNVTETFDPEQTNTIEMQQAGWQAILNNFKKYVEASVNPEMQHFEICINAKAEKVFKTMIAKKQYEEWTTEFNPDSHFEGSWEKGSRILFLGTDQNGNTGGMIGRIRENIPNKFLSIAYVGVVLNGKEILSGPEVESWAGAMENYTFKDKTGETILAVDVAGTNQEFKSYFTETWPKALKKLKAICEQ